MSLLLSSEMRCGLFIRSLLPEGLRLTHQLPISSPAPLGMRNLRVLSPSLSTEQHFKGRNYLAELETWLLLYQIMRLFFLLAPMTGAAQEDVLPLTAWLQFLAGSSVDLLPLVAVHPSDTGWKAGFWDDPLSCCHSNREHLCWSVITYSTAAHGRKDYICNQHCALWCLLLFQPEEFNALRYGK